MKKTPIGTLAVAAAGLVLLQLTNPARTNPPVEGDFLKALSPPTDVSARLRSACYDCHSHETEWPWYSRIAPVSWTVVGDVNRARARLDLSAWPANDARRSARKLRAMSEEIRSREMPLPKYTLIHHEARLTQGQRDEPAHWLTAQAGKATDGAGRPPATALSRTRPGDLGTGRTLFLKNCAHCHGADARGGEGPDLHELGWTESQIAARIRNGKKGEMPAFAGKLSPEDIIAFTEYLKSLGRAD